MAAALSLVLLAALAMAVVSASAHKRSAHLLDLPPRLMWGWSPPAPSTASGFCGSMSVQTAGIYYGNWISENYVRGTSGGHDAEHSILIKLHGKNSVRHACKKLKLVCTDWNYNNASSPQSKAFLEWSKEAIDAGWPVIIGVFGSSYNDKQYDHIVPMVGYDDTAIYMNDLQKNRTLRYEESEFVQTRRGCQGNDALEWCLPRSVDFGVSVQGNADEDGVLLPVRMALSSWTEPDYSKEDRLHEKPSLLTANLTITSLEAGERYALLRYENPVKVPDRNFLQSNFKHKTVFVASAQTHKFATKFMSNSTVFFRCVKVNGVTIV